MSHCQADPWNTISFRNDHLKHRASKLEPLSSINLECNQWPEQTRVVKILFYWLNLILYSPSCEQYFVRKNEERALDFLLVKIPYILQASNPLVLLISFRQSSWEVFFYTASTIFSQFFLNGTYNTQCRQLCQNRFPIFPIQVGSTGEKCWNYFIFVL